MTDDIDDKLEKQKQARQKLQAQLSETSAALGEIEDRIENWNARQEARMKADDRLDNKLVEKVTQSGSTKEKAAKQLGQQKKPEDSRIKLVPDNLTLEDVTAKPKDNS